MAIWKTTPTLEALNSMNAKTLVDHIGIEFTEIGDDYLKGTMPVDDRTVQPMRLLHGGANVVLAETLGSVASVLCLSDMTQQSVVGLEINANHLKAVRSGKVTGTCRPIRIGRRIHVWEIKIEDEVGHLSCISRLTISIIDRKVTE